MAKVVHECGFCNQKWFVQVNHGIRGEGKTYRTMQMCQKCGSKMITAHEMFEPKPLQPGEYISYDYVGKEFVKKDEKTEKAPRGSIKEESQAKRSKWEAVKV